jgi:hypothetical protein
VPEHISSKSRDDALGRGGQQKNLHEVHQPLECKERQQSDGDAVEELTIPRLERRVEQIPNDERKCEADGGGDEQTDRGNGEARAIWPQARQ